MRRIPTGPTADTLARAARRLYPSLDLGALTRETNAAIGHVLKSAARNARTAGGHELDVQDVMLLTGLGFAETARIMKGQIRTLREAQYFAAILGGKLSISFVPNGSDIVDLYALVRTLPNFHEKWAAVPKVKTRASETKRWERKGYIVLDTDGVPQADSLLAPEPDPYERMAGCPTYPRPMVTAPWDPARAMFYLPQGGPHADRHVVRARKAGVPPHEHRYYQLPVTIVPRDELLRGQVALWRALQKSAPPKAPEPTPRLHGTR